MRRDLGREDAVAEMRAVEEKHGGGEQESEEVFVIPISHAIIYPHAMMVCSRDARIAQTAMFAPRWFRETACPALCVFVEDAIVGVAAEVEGQS